MTPTFKPKWLSTAFRKEIAEFNDLYAERPIRDNPFGMKSPHLFHVWFILKKLKPRYLIESGVYQGLGTWFFEKASPNTKIFCIDPDTQARKYTSPAASYHTTDFSKSDWSHLTPNDTLVFFDDHQNFADRLSQCVNFGFKKIICEDNYPVSQGDCISPKKILSEKPYTIDYQGIRTQHPPLLKEKSFLENHVDTYQELPPLFRAKTTRWGDPWSEDNYPTPNPLLSENHKKTYPTLFEERLHYTWICYLELS